MERLKRNNNKNNGNGAKNNKTQKQEQSPKGISKNVKTAIRKIKTALKRHVVGSCSSISHSPPENEVKNKRKTNANKQKESLNKKINRPKSTAPSASSKHIRGTSQNAPASSSDKTAKKTTVKSKRVGKVRKPDKKVDKSKIINIKNAVFDGVKNDAQTKVATSLDIQTPSCSSTNISLATNSSDTSNIISSKDMRIKWLNKRLEKERLEKIIIPESRPRYSAQNRLQLLRDRLNKEAESEAESEASTLVLEPTAIGTNIAVLKPLVNNTATARQRRRAIQQNSYQQQQPPTNVQTIQYDSDVDEPFSNTSSLQNRTNTYAQNSRAGEPLQNTYVPHNGLGSYIPSRYVQNGEIGEPSTSSFVQNTLRQSLSNTYVQNCSTVQPSTTLFLQNSAERQPISNTYLQNSAAVQPSTNQFVQIRAANLPLLNLNVQNSPAEQSSTSADGQNSTTGISLSNIYVQSRTTGQPATSSFVQNTAIRQPLSNTNVQNSAAEQPSPNLFVQNRAANQPLLNLNEQNSADISLSNIYVQSSAGELPRLNLNVRNTAAGQPLSNAIVQNRGQPSTSSFAQNTAVRQPLLNTNVPNSAAEQLPNNEADVNTYAEVHNQISERQYEDMDIDNDDTAAPNPFIHSSYPQSNQRLEVVIDTNVFIHKLSIIKHIVASYFIGFVEKPTLIIPWRVINELDTLKDNRNRPTVQRLANDAMNYLYEMLPKQESVQGQTLSDAKDHLFVCEVPDDEILNCCLQRAAKGNNVLLLTNDKNLCNKATINGIKNMSSRQIESKIEDRLFNYAPGELIQARLRIYKANIYDLLSTILRNEMQRVFEENWTLIVRVSQPWTLMDVLNCILNHWIAVFDQVFPRIKQSITQLKSLLFKLDAKEITQLTDNEVGAFQEICMEIAHRCLIIADYMVLASQTLNALNHSPHMDIETKELRQEKLLNNVFQNMYTYLSSYCAKVCTGLDIQHNLVDESSSTETTEELLTVLPLFNRRVNSITQTLQETLNADANNLLAKLTDFNSICAEIDGNFAFLNKYEISPTYYFGKCRDLFLKEYKSYYEMCKLFKKCLDQVRDNALLPGDS